MRLYCTNQGPKLDEQHVRAYEATTGLKLPEDYVSFLLEVNGGHPNGMYEFPITGLADSDYMDVHGLYGLNHPDEGYDLEANRRLRAEPVPEWLQSVSGTVPDWLLPVGFDSLNDKICLAVSGPRYGQVFFWDLTDQTASPNNIYFIADSFQGFLDSLRPGS
jgi:hypothetical protein